jgi:hypothetical protein
MAEGRKTDAIEAVSTLKQIRLADTLGMVP